MRQLQDALDAEFHPDELRRILDHQPACRAQSFETIFGTQAHDADAAE